MDFNLTVISDQLPTACNTQERRERMKMFNNFDPNGNGYLSLAEVDRGIIQVLKLEKVVHAKPAIFQAFKAAKNCVKTKTAYGNDYIERIEFRYFLLFLQ